MSSQRWNAASRSSYVRRPNALSRTLAAYAADTRQTARIARHCVPSLPSAAGGTAAVVEVRSATTREMMASLVRTSATGCVAMSNSRKLRFSVRRTPLSTRPLASRSRTCLSWKPIFMTFHVSPEHGLRLGFAGRQDGGNGEGEKGANQPSSRAHSARGGSGFPRPRRLRLRTHRSRGLSSCSPPCALSPPGPSSSAAPHQGSSLPFVGRRAPRRGVLRAGDVFDLGP